MRTQSYIQTKRLIIRPFRLTDANAVQEMAGDYEIAKWTMSIPHPYPEGAAKQWIGTHQRMLEDGTAVVFAIASNTDGRLLGCIGLTIQREHQRAEMGYWIGKPYWGNGYCTEAAEAVLEYAFRTLRLNRVYAHHFEGNEASGRVMQKIGMVQESRMRKHVYQWGEFRDYIGYGILREDYEKTHGSLRI